MRVLLTARRAASAFATLTMLACAACAEPTTLTSAPSGMPRIVAGVRERFGAHWTELLADPSPAAARTRAEVVAWALRDDNELLAKMQAKEALAEIVARGLADARRATEAFPDAPDTWMTLARIRAYAGDVKEAHVAACRASALDRASTEAAAMCVHDDAWAAADRAMAKRVGAPADPRAAPIDPRATPIDPRATPIDPHVALRAAEAHVPYACTAPATRLSWAELVACGDADARAGRVTSARQRYRAAALGAANEEAQYLALQRIEQLDGDCRAVLLELPARRAEGYARWKLSLGARIRPPLFAP